MSERNPAAMSLAGGNRVLARATSGTGALRAAVDQLLLILPVFAVTAVLAMAGLGSVARPLFLLGGLGIAVWYHRRSPWLYLTSIFWFWTLTPFARRLIDFHAGFDATSIMLATPNVMSALIIVDLLKNRTSFRQPEAMFATALLGAVVYGLSVSMVQGQIFMGAVGAMDWLIPVLYYFYILDHAADIEAADAHFRSFLLLNGLVVVGYGLVQFWQPPAWDVRWALESGMESKSEFNTDGAFRVFGTLNETGVYAFWLATLIVLSLHFRSRLSVLILPAAGLLLLLTNDRSVAVGAVVCLVVAALLGGPRIGRGLLIMTVAGIAMSVVFASLNPAVVDRLAERFGGLDHIAQDDSALVRAAIWQRTPGLIDNHPFGMGIGALGRGAVVSNDAGLISVDFGLLAVYLSLGWVAGTVYVVAMAGVGVQAVIGAARSRDPAALAFAAAALGMLLQMFVLNVIGFSAAILWLCAGLTTAHAMRARLRPVGPRAVDLRGVARHTGRSPIGPAAVSR